MSRCASTRAESGGFMVRAGTAGPPRVLALVARWQRRRGAVGHRYSVMGPSAVTRYSFYRSRSQVESPRGALEEMRCRAFLGACRFLLERQQLPASPLCYTLSALFGPD